MKLGVASAVLVVVAMGAGCGGGSNPRFEEVSHQFYKAYCTRLHACMLEQLGTDLGTSSWLKAYPNGQDDCVDDNYKEFSSLNELESTCGQDVWDKCAKELETSPCTKTKPLPTSPDVVGVKIPQSCTGC